MRNRFIAQLLVVVAIMLPALAQSQTMNNYSAYSMYGLGEINTQGTMMTRSMGGAGVAMRSRVSINILNPASYSMALQKGILFDFSMDATQYMNAQTINGVTQRGYNLTANFHDVALQLPITKGMGLGFSVSPYSSVGYQQQSEGLTDDFDYVQYANYGSGDITLVKFGVGYQLTKRLSVGAAALYYWGDITRSFDAVIFNFASPGTANSASGEDLISTSKIKGQLGAQWSALLTEKKALFLGATYDIGGDLKPEYSRVITGDDSTLDDDDVYAQSDTTTLSISLPRTLTVGMSYNTEKISLAVDYSYQNWGDGNKTVEFATSGIDVAYRNVHVISAGLEYTPRRVDVRNYFNRVAYRVGVRYGGYQYTYNGENVDQMNLSAGMGFPITGIVGISKVNVGLDWGSIGSRKVLNVGGSNVGMVRQNTIKLSLGVTFFGDDYWFQRPQID
ncbi:MAG: hypothetical protein R3Y16_07305 [Rikenellaceae bacterium]